MLELSANFMATGLTEVTNSDARQSSPLILVADDDKFTRMLLRQILQKDGYQVEEVENGEQCLAAYKRLRPDMVLLDAIMPVMDGFTCCTQLQNLGLDNAPLGDSEVARVSSQATISRLANVRLTDTPILMITGLDDQKSVDRAFEAGATDYVTKPIHPPVLRRRLRRILEASWAQKALQESEEKHRSVVENLNEVIFQTDTVGKLTFLNPAWKEITGFSIEESLGKNFLQFLHPEDHQVYWRQFHSLIQGTKEDCRYQTRILTKNSGVGWLEVYCCRRVRADKTLIGTGGTFNDITLRKHREQHLSVENSTIRILAESATIEDAAPHILQAIGQSLGWNLGELWKMDQQSGVLRLAETWYLPSPELLQFETNSKQITFAPGDGLPGSVWQSGQPRWIADLREDSNFHRSSLAAKIELHSAFAFPILGGNEKLGVVSFFSNEPKQLDADLLKMMAAIGSQIGQFIKRKQAEQEVQRQNLILSSELKQAAAYVRSLLPSVLTGAITTQQQFVPSLQLGGDAFDYYWLDDQHLAIYLLDVAGHGVKSALLSVSVLNILRSQSLANTDFYQPSAVLIALNQIFQMGDSGDDYFTIWYGVYNQVTHQLVYTSAGHPPAILLSGNSNTTSIKKLGATGIPIGMLPEMDFEDNYCEIPPESTLYVFSDGVYEIPQADGDIWGINSLIDLLGDYRQSNITNLDQVFHYIQNLNGQKVLDDDFSLLQVNLG